MMAEVQKGEEENRKRKQEEAGRRRLRMSNKKDIED
jgi:hypothetical protein